MIHSPHTIYRTLTALLAAVLAVVVSACSDVYVSEENTQPGTDGDLTWAAEAQAGFYITVGDAVPGTAPAASATRAAMTAADGYDPGQGYENYIDIEAGDYRFYFFDSDDQFVSQFEPTVIRPVYEGVGTKTYEVRGMVNATTIVGQPFKVLVLANWGTYPEPAAGTTLQSMLTASAPSNVYTYSRSMPSQSARIPLFGIKLFSDIKFANNTLTDIGTLHLLRALAKITVSCGTPGYNMSRVRLTRYHTTGLKAPLGVNTEAGYVHGDYDLDYVDNVSLPAGVATGTDLEFVKTADNPATYTIYVPEYRNVDTRDADRLTPLSTYTRIKVNFDDCLDPDDHSRLRDYYIDFMYYSGNKKDKYFDVRRNYWYQYEVTKYPDQFDLGIVVDVIPFSEVKVNPGFGLERDDISGYIIVRDPKDPSKILYWLDNESNKWYIYQDENTRYIFAYDDPGHSDLDHWFDFTGVKHPITPDGITGYTPVYDTTHRDQLLYWEDKTGHKVWLEMTALYSVKVFNYNQGGSNPSGAVQYWFDFLGNLHQTPAYTEANERAVLAQWINILEGKL